MTGPRAFVLQGEPIAGTRVAFWTYQPYVTNGYAERWIVVSEGQGFGSHGACRIYLNTLIAAYWKYPDHNTAAYFQIPSSAVGMTFYAQAIVKVGGRVDLSGGLRITIKP